MEDRTWYHTSEEANLTPRRKQRGAVGGGLHLGSVAAGRHVRYEKAAEYTSVTGSQVYPRQGRPYVHAFGVMDGQQFSRSADRGVDWPRQPPANPTLYRNDVEDAGSDSLWAAPEHLEPRGVLPNKDVHVTELPESQVRASADGRIVEQLRVPGTSDIRAQYWDREDDA